MNDPEITIGQYDMREYHERLAAALLVPGVIRERVPMIALTVLIPNIAREICKASLREYGREPTCEEVAKSIVLSLALQAAEIIKCRKDSATAPGGEEFKLEV